MSVVAASKKKGSSIQYTLEFHALFLDRKRTKSNNNKLELFSFFLFLSLFESQDSLTNGIP